MLTGRDGFQTLDCDGKFRNEIGSYKRVQKISDSICNEHGLSVVENPGLSKGKTNRYKTPTKRDGLAGLIDEILETHRPKNFEEFLKQLEKSGCKVKRRGKTISVMPEGAERYFRLKAGKKGLPEGYDEESLRRKIAEMHSAVERIYNEGTASELENAMLEMPLAVEESNLETPLVEVESGEFLPAISSVADSKTEAKPAPATTAPANEANTPPADAPVTSPVPKVSPGKKINLIIDLENSIKAKESSGYEWWAKGFNLQQAAETLLFLQTNNLTDMDTLTRAAALAKTEYDGLQKRIDAASSRISEVNTLQRHIGAYNKNRDTYSQYLRSKRNPKFRQENEKAIATVEEAKAYFDSLGMEKLPSIKELREEYSALSQERQNCQQVKKEMKQHVYDLQSAKANAEMLLGISGAQDNERTKSKAQISER